ncbi:YbaN family protein [Psychromonas aquatilis]|uniref:Inner membrane protein n=1 Tax=Psychromonas aquatilis TaxID=2005072 RepID=A0ABU9GS75_9GAMM
MRQKLIKCILFVVACLASILGFLGVVLPLLPATPFFLLALFAFSKSSPRFQHWLLNLPGIGDDLRSWQTHKKINKQRKPVIYLSIFISFVISISLLMGQPLIQSMLIILMLIILLCIRKLPEF